MVLEGFCETTVTDCVGVGVEQCQGEFPQWPNCEQHLPYSQMLLPIDPPPQVPMILEGFCEDTDADFVGVAVVQCEGEYPQ